MTCIFNTVVKTKCYRDFFWVAPNLVPPNHLLSQFALLHLSEESVLTNQGSVSIEQIHVTIHNSDIQWFSNQKLLFSDAHFLLATHYGDEIIVSDFFHITTFNCDKFAPMEATMNPNDESNLIRQKNIIVWKIFYKAVDLFFHQHFSHFLILSHCAKSFLLSKFSVIISLLWTILHHWHVMEYCDQTTEVLYAWSWRKLMYLKQAHRCSYYFLYLT
jgi:hypothetical protein